ncbi:MAG: hypothetical protein ABIB71_09470 [Candidatus Woesearchaeota archaeon]
MKINAKEFLTLKECENYANSFKGEIRNIDIEVVAIGKKKTYLLKILY